MYTKTLIILENIKDVRKVSIYLYKREKIILMYIWSQYTEKNKEFSSFTKLISKKFKSVSTFYSLIQKYILT